MDAESAAPSPTPAKPAAKPEIKPVIGNTSRVYQITPKDQFLALIGDLKFQGATAHPARKAAAEAVLKILTDDFADAEAFSATVETTGTATGHQILVRLTKHTFEK